MQRTYSASTRADPPVLFDVVADLGTYPHWMTLVDRVEATGPGPDGAPAWSVTLRARIGPLARSKRLRMVRTVNDGHRVCFERRELDGRTHSAWELSAIVAADGDPWRSRVDLDLSYGGSLWSGLLDAVLQQSADDAIDGLQSYVANRVEP